jgi:hypothetical protein
VWPFPVLPSELVSLRCWAWRESLELRKAEQQRNGACVKKTEACGQEGSEVRGESGQGSGFPRVWLPSALSPITPSAPPSLEFIINAPSVQVAELVSVTYDKKTVMSMVTARDSYVCHAQMSKKLVPSQQEREHPLRRRRSEWKSV